MKRTLLVLALGAFLSSGCYRTIIKSGATPAGGGQDETKYSLLWGLTSTEASAPECRDGIARTETYLPWWGVMCVAPLTGGIVMPVKVNYSCAADDR